MQLLINISQDYQIYFICQIIITMTEEKQKIPQIGAKSLFLDTVIDCITESKNSPVKRQQNSTQDNINLHNLYDKAGTIISQLDGSINRCIKYNQARTNRKYEIIITDLQNQIKKLSQKLKLQQDARSPTKKHISDILDKLVVFRDQNNKLKEEIKLKDKKIAELQKQLNEQTKALQKIELEQPKAIIQRLPPVSGIGTVCDSIKNFLKDKEVVKKLTNKSSSKLQKFLYQHKAKSWNWTVPVLLQELQKWSQGIIVQKNQVDMWRIRSNIARKFSNQIDDSGTLTKPSRINSLSVAQQLSPRENKQLTTRKMTEGFSYKGSKQKLNYSVL